MNLFQTSFLLLGKFIRILPRVRGKVALGNYYYKFFSRRQPQAFAVQATLFREGLIFKLDLDCAHERMAYLMGQYEQETVFLLEELWRGGKLLDVGANIGLIAIPFTARAKEKQRSLKRFVYAIEAMPSNFQALHKNIELNNLGDAVVPINVGLGAQDAEVFIQIEGDDPNKTGTANILPSALDFVKVPLKLRSIDTMIEEGLLPDDISLIKIDTDGYDFEVLKGAARLLSSNRPLVFAEMSEYCLNWHGYGIREVASYLARSDYEVWPLVGFGPPTTFSSHIDADYEINCLLVPQERRPELSRYLV
jgi:FkbM family methyltransferase